MSKLDGALLEGHTVAAGASNPEQLRADRMTLIRRSKPLSAFIALALCACAGKPIETHRSVPAGQADVQRMVAAEMASLGLAVTMNGDGTITGRTNDAPVDWARCSPALVGRGGGEHTSRRLVSVSSRQATVRVALMPAGQATTVDLLAVFSASYVNPERGGNFDQPCRSKGVLEMRILEAAG
ncbi:MAG: hypothetical protein AB7I59_08130 [Geminicoccaceae bacterium]